MNSSAASRDRGAEVRREGSGLELGRSVDAPRAASAKLADHGPLNRLPVALS